MTERGSHEGRNGNNARPLHTPTVPDYDYPPLFGTGTYVIGGIATPLVSAGAGYFLNRYSGAVPLNVAGAVETIGAAVMVLDLAVVTDAIIDIPYRVRNYRNQRKVSREKKQAAFRTRERSITEQGAVLNEASDNPRSVESAENQIHETSSSRFNWPRAGTLVAAATPPAAALTSYLLNRSSGEVALNVAGAVEITGSAVTILDLFILPKAIKRIPESVSNFRAKRRAAKPSEKK